MSDVAIRVQGLSKLYRIGERQRYKSLRESLMKALAAPFRQRGQRPRETIWALDDVSFEVMRGEVLGVIGRNGAGKSTLLKILSRITEPTRGRVEVYGRVGSLLEIGTGFHLELTGRENIYLNGAILGMRRVEIERKFDEIVAFAEVERFLDTPVKHFSSGMYLRLAFAVAAHLEPEILLVDEVLAVGDASFQKKCIGKMGDVAKEGRTVLFVSHNMAAIRLMCENCLLIEAGKLALVGSSQAVVERYLTGDGREDTGEFQAHDSGPDSERVGVRLLRVSVRNRQGNRADTLPTDEPFSVTIGYELVRRLDNFRLGFQLIANDGTVVFASGDTDPNGWGVPRGPGSYESTCIVPANLLNAGRFHLTVACDRPMQEILFAVENAVSFTMALAGGAGSAVPDHRAGVVRPSLEWRVHEIQTERHEQEGKA